LTKGERTLKLFSMNSLRVNANLETQKKVKIIVANPRQLGIIKV